MTKKNVRILAKPLFKPNKGLLGYAKNIESDHKYGIYQSESDVVRYKLMMSPVTAPVL